MNNEAFTASWIGKLDRNNWFNRVKSAFGATLGELRKESLEVMKRVFPPIQPLVIINL
jgi:hypothetical protein